MSRDDKNKIKPGITIDRDVWEEFKKRYPNSSQAIQSMMEKAIELREITDTFTSENIQSVTFDNAENWNLSWSSGSVQVTNSSFNSETTSKTINSWKNISIK